MVLMEALPSHPCIDQRIGRPAVVETKSQDGVEGQSCGLDPNLLYHCLRPYHIHDLSQSKHLDVYIMSGWEKSKQRRMETVTSREA